jgi:phosphomannomutase
MSEPGRHDWVSVAEAWIDQDPDPATREELAALVVARDLDALAERLGATLEFGTAGLRGVVGAGPNRMNQAVVTRVARGLAEHLRDRVPDARALPVVVGHDARLSSPVFAEVVVGVLVAAGLRVRYFERAVPTPLVAYAAKQLGAVAAVVVTASHNPAEYNGIKVYAENAAQLGPPADEEVARRIAAVGSARAVPRRDAIELGSDPGAEPVSEALFERYLAELDLVRGGAAGARDLRIVYTPLHGVGARFVERALRRAGYAAVDVLPEQAAPDGASLPSRGPTPRSRGCSSSRCDGPPPWGQISCSPTTRTPTASRFASRGRAVASSSSPGIKWGSCSPIISSRAPAEPHRPWSCPRSCQAPCWSGWSTIMAPAWSGR